MIILDDVTKLFGIGSKERPALSAVSATLPSHQRIALIASSPEESKLFIELLAGFTLPTSGRVVRKATVSFPVGDVGGFNTELSVRSNVLHLARVYQADPDQVLKLVKSISGLRREFNKPFMELSNQSKRLISSVLAFTIPFDVYLIQEKIIRPQFETVVHSLFEARMKTSGMLIASDNDRFITTYCDRALVLRKGRIRLFDNVDRAIAFAERIGISLRKGRGSIPKTAGHKRKRHQRHDDE